MAEEPCRKKMPFPYYDNLSATLKRTYRKSDAIESIPVENHGEIYPVVMKLKKSLEDNNRRDVARYASEICRLVCRGLGTDTLVVKVKSRRPSRSDEELQGLYERTEGETAVLTIWMRTAAKGQVVAFKSFIRTVFHELCHHLDYAYFNLNDSLHTEGFFKRESSLYRQIVPVELRNKEPKKENAPPKTTKKRVRKKPEQMRLF